MSIKIKLIIKNKITVGLDWDGDKNDLETNVSKHLVVFSFSTGLLIIFCCIKHLNVGLSLIFFELPLNNL